MNFGRNAYTPEHRQLCCSCSSRPKCLPALDACNRNLLSETGDPSVPPCTHGLWQGRPSRAHTCTAGNGASGQTSQKLAPPSLLLRQVNSRRISPSTTPLLFLRCWPKTASSQAQQQTQRAALLPGVTRPRGQGACKDPPGSRSKPGSSHHLLDYTGVTPLSPGTGQSHVWLSHH